MVKQKSLGSIVPWIAGSGLFFTMIPQFIGYYNKYQGYKKEIEGLIKDFRTGKELKELVGNHYCDPKKRSVGNIINRKLKEGDSYDYDDPGILQKIVKKDLCKKIR